MSFNELKQRGKAGFPIELYRIDKNHAQYEMTSHWHSENELIRVKSGKLYVKLNNNVYTLSDGDCIFVNSETVHGAIPENCVYDCVVFDASAFLVSFSEGTSPLSSFLGGTLLISEYFPSSVKSVCSAFDSLISSLEEEDNIGKKYTVTGAVYSLFGIIISGGYFFSHEHSPAIQSEKNVAKLKKVLYHISERFDTKLTLEELSAIADMSPKYFCAFFKEMTRQSPFEYINSYRTDRAAKFLLSTDMSITDIAFSCGFSDLSYFIKTFKLLKGTTPGAFRKK